MPKQKILYLTQHPHIGGGETSLLYLLQGLNRRLFEPHVVLPGPGQLSTRLNTLGIPQTYIPLPPYLSRTLFLPGFSFSGVRDLYRLTAKLKPDLIHLNHANLILYAGLVGRLRRIPVVLTIHGPWDAYYFFQNLLYRVFSSRLLPNKPELRVCLMKYQLIPASRIEVVPFGVDTEFFCPGGRTAARRKLGLPNPVFIITIVGRLDPIKDHLTFLKTAELVLTRLPNTYFYIVGSCLGNFAQTGSGPETYAKSIELYCRQRRQLSRRVIWGGYRTQMPLVYQATDILVSTSLSESFPLTLIEGAACGVPVVTTNQGGQRLIVKDGQSGFLVPPVRPDLIAQKILILLKNTQLRQRFGRVARSIAVKNFRLDKYCRRIETIYTRCIT